MSVPRSFYHSLSFNVQVETWPLGSDHPDSTFPWKTSCGKCEGVLASFQQHKREGGGARIVMLCSATRLPSGILLSEEAASPGHAHCGVDTEGPAHWLSRSALCLGSSASSCKKSVCVRACVCVCMLGVDRAWGGMWKISRSLASSQS